MDYRDQNRSLAGLIDERGIPISLTQGVTERIPGALVTGNYFTVLGVRPARGRLIGPDDDRIPGVAPVAVISHRFWQNALDSDPAVIGRKLILNGYAFTVIGVAPQQFHGLSIGQQIDVWVPMVPQREADLAIGGLATVYGRLRPGVSLDQSRTELGALARGLQLRYPDTNADRTVTLTRNAEMDPDQHRSLNSLLGLLLASGALLLLIACQNEPISSSPGRPGLLVTMPLARFLASFLYGVTARDPATLALVWIPLVLVTIPASYFPARAAMRIDPMVALREN